jgi:hypothetical protein
VGSSLGFVAVAHHFDAGGIGLDGLDGLDGFSVAAPEVGTDPTRVYVTDSRLTHLRDVDFRTWRRESSETEARQLPQHRHT